MKEGYGDGNYSLYPAKDAPVFGEDFAAILKHFEACRGIRAFNQKIDVSPVALKAYLPWVSLIEPLWGGDGRLADGRVTLHGSAVAGAYSEITHKRVREAHKPDVADRVIASMQHAIDIRSAVIGVSDERHVMPHVRLHILYMPLSEDGETVNRFFSYVRLDPLD
ncbi:hypothetical protein SAMN04488071_2661 [Kordiimonas lacus]|uniref:PAS domain-containing protein n=1 Tax=Kordiimonas lacus TaxID=637679 RepID=A0A1G7C506_9PROT|nr:hypothetical protein SAMN04488071_2661 [Kordiimonas lacus]